jgi:hypothetical protein
MSQSLFPKLLKTSTYPEITIILQRNCHLKAKQPTTPNIRNILHNQMHLSAIIVEKIETYASAGKFHIEEGNFKDKPITKT